MNYILGVDGGGTKTDFLLFDHTGNYVDHLKTGTCSHEILGFDGAKESLRTATDNLLLRNNLKKSDLIGIAFGLAGIDTPNQRNYMHKILMELNFVNFEVNNDAFLGIKAGSPNGQGICSINGTGTVCVGIDKKQSMLQIGGNGDATGDSAGGGTIATKAVRAVYDAIYRCGLETNLQDKIFSILEVADYSDFYNCINEKFYQGNKYHKAIVIALFESANEKDAVAISIVEELANQLAKSVGGCIRLLDFHPEPAVILAGSVWVKSNCPLLLNHFVQQVYHYTKVKITPTILDVVPAVGGVVWAMELAQGSPITREQRNLILSNAKHIQ